MRGVDLCGFSDSEGRDSDFIDAMVTYLKEEVQYVTCFLLLLNSQEARVGRHLKDMLVALRNVFGLGISKHLLIGFTRWDYSKRGQVLRSGGHAATKDFLSESVNEDLRKILGHDHACDCVFLDNSLHMCSDHELQEMYSMEELSLVQCAFGEALAAVRSAVVNNPPFLCVNLESVAAQRDVTKREAAARTEGREAHNRFMCKWASFCEAAFYEPRGLEDRLQIAAQAAHIELERWLAPRCEPELLHVMVSVLESFDANAPLECFDNTHRKFSEVVDDFLVRCRGGSLAWAALSVLQDQLRMTQVDARENIFRQHLKEGKELPPLSESGRTPELLVSLLHVEKRHVPEWLMALGGSVEVGG